MYYNSVGSDTMSSNNEPSLVKLKQIGVQFIKSFKMFCMNGFSHNSEMERRLKAS